VCESIAVIDLVDVRVLAAGLDHPEGVTLGPDGALYAGGEAGQLYRIDSTGGFEEIATVSEGMLLGLCFDARGRIYACDASQAAVVRYDPDGGATDVYCDSAAGGALRLPNFPAFAADGSLYVSDSGSEDPAVVDGRVLRVPPEGGDAEVLDLPPLHFPNGLAVGPDGTLYIALSFTPGVLALKDGRLESVCELPGTVPDGLALDAEGGILVSCYQPNRVVRVEIASGGVGTVVEDWMGMRILSPTNIAFFGPDRHELALASLCGWTVSAVTVPWAGEPLVFPEL
jgi:gluconolactonase